MFYLKKALLWAVSVILTSTFAYAGNSEHVPISQNASRHIIELKPIPESYKTAGLVFLPELEDSEFGWNGKEFSSNHNKGDNCSGYELTSCPVHGSCSSCPFDRRYKRLVSCTGGYTKNGNSCKASSCSAVGYESSIPANKICTKYTEGSLTCYKDCKSVSCSGYTLNCDSFNVANSAGKATCPDCESGNANCSPKLCKVGSCLDGFKIADNGTTCVALDDNCPDGYFKECETGTQGDPQYTEKGTACWQCKPKIVEAAAPILYSDMTVSKEIITGKTPIGVVFNESKKLAIALNIKNSLWSTTKFDVPDLPNIDTSQRSTASADYNGKNNTKTIVNYCSSNGKNCPAAEYANSYTTAGTKSGDWYLPALGEINDMFANFEVVNKSLSLVSGTLISYDSHWTSTEVDSIHAWCPYGDLNDLAGCDKSYFDNFLVRPVINYGDDNNALPILYSDLTTSTEVIAGKTPIGIVFDESKKLAIALNYESKVWSTENFNIPSLIDYTSGDSAKGDWAGRSNTNIILAYCRANGKSCPAAEYVDSYKTAGTNAGDWYLPALGELNALYSHKTAVNESLEKAKGTSLPDNSHWSSSVYSSAGNAWGLGFGTGSTYNNNKTIFSGSIRPVINYGEVKQTCNAANCETCVSGSSVRCQICKSGYKVASGVCCTNDYKYDCDENSGMYGKGTVCGGLYKSCGCTDNRETWWHDENDSYCKETIYYRLEGLSTSCDYDYGGCDGWAYCVYFGTISGEISREYIDTWLWGDSSSIDHISVETELDNKCYEKGYELGAW